MEPYIGIIKGNPGWIQLLNQEGLFYKLFKPGENPSVLIVDDLSLNSEILDYLEEGGFILTHTEILGKLLNESTKSVKIEYIIPDNSPFFRNVGIVDIYNRGYILNRNGYGSINNRYPAVYEFTYKKGSGIALPFDVSSVIPDASRMMKFFYTKKGRLPTEIVSSASKGEIRKLVVNGIRYLIRKRGLYYIHKWYYPENKKTVFIFRVDTDESNFGEILNTYRIAEKNRLGFTFFIDVRSIGKDVRRLKELKKQEIAVHSFKHSISKDSLKNRENFSKANEILQKAGIKAKGIAIPYGIWNSQLCFIMEELGFLYSSEFSFSYDDLPSYPFMEPRFSNVLQIPVHPISPGTLLYARNNIADIMYYFEQIIREKLKKEDPIVLYGHSGVISRYPSILEHIIHLLKEEKDIWTGTFIDFYKWWRMRDDTNLEIKLDGNTLKAKKTNNISLHIISPDDKEAIVQIRESIDLNKLKWQKMSKIEPFDRRTLKVKKGALKLKLKEIENWLRR